MKKYLIITYGCQQNKSDSERIASILENTSYRQASSMNEADLIIVNACSVRQSAIDRIWGQTQKFAKLKMKNKKLKTILTCCLLQKDRSKFAKRFNLILGINDLPKLPQILKKDKATAPSSHYLAIKPIYSSNFAANIPIMTGCDNFCTFCVVPYARGREISRSTDEILCEVKNIVKRGYKEIWLLGQNVNSYKYGKINFPKLLKMTRNIPGDFWIRFTSSHPKDFSEELINVIANCKKITEYLNLPVQSGDDEILKKMNRPYTIKQYKGLIKKIRAKIPGITLSTDVIVGFPGETKRQFQNTVKLFKEIRYDMAYISQFSPRPGTAADKFKDDVSHQEKERRWKTLTNILRETALEKNKQHVGKTIEVLPDDYKDGFLAGKSRNYKTVKFKGSKNLIGKFVKVEILEALPWSLKGKLIN